jgi:hypothetical protein
MECQVRRHARVKRLKALEDENAKLKRLLADAMLDPAALNEVLSKNGRLGITSISGIRVARELTRLTTVQGKEHRGTISNPGSHQTPALSTQLDDTGDLRCLRKVRNTPAHGGWREMNCCGRHYREQYQQRRL